jgi:hypothetical protein
MTQSGGEARGIEPLDFPGVLASGVPRDEEGVSIPYITHDIASVRSRTY